MPHSPLTTEEWDQLVSAMAMLARRTASAKSPFETNHDVMRKASALIGDAMLEAANQLAKKP